MSARPIIHIEFSARGPASAARFYSELFGWTTQPLPDADTNTFDAPAERGAGLVPLGDAPGIRPGEGIVYVATDDPGGMLAQAEIRSATVELPRAAWYAICRDPSGNRAGLCQAGRERLS